MIVVSEEVSFGEVSVVRPVMYLFVGRVFHVQLCMQRFPSCNGLAHASLRSEELNAIYR